MSKGFLYSNVRLMLQFLEYRHTGDAASSSYPSSSRIRVCRIVRPNARLASSSVLPDGNSTARLSEDR